MDGVEVYDTPLYFMRLCFKEVHGIDIYILGSNGQAEEAVALQGTRLKRVSRVERVRPLAGSSVPGLLISAQ